MSVRPAAGHCREALLPRAYTWPDGRSIHERHIGMFALDDHMAVRVTTMPELPDRIAW